MSTPTDIDDGGPAFPWEDIQDTTGEPRPSSDMKLRDWFAGQALAGWAAGRNNGGDFNEPSPSKAEFVARSCYEYADAMIEARKQKGTAA